MIFLAHRIELDPTVKQRIYFSKACGVSRFAYMWALREWQKQYEAGEKPSEGKLRKQLNAIKDTEYPWMREVSKTAPQYAIKALGDAFQRFFKKKSGYPAKKKKGVHDSFRVDNGMDGKDGFKLSETHSLIPKLGKVRLKESPRFLGKRVVQAYISKEADRWFLSVTFDLGESYSCDPAIHRSESVGVDLGLTSSATLSTGEKLESPKPLRKYRKRLSRLSRRHSRKKKGSNNRKKSQRKLARLHVRIKNVRNDWIHKLTSKLCRENQTVKVETLAVSNLMKNSRLARSIADQGWYEFRRQLTYKAPLYKTVLVLADRFLPSSKTCSNCGVKREGKLELSVREWTCTSCNEVHDRDINAAKNLNNLRIPEVIRELTPVESKATVRKYFRISGQATRGSRNHTVSQKGIK